MRSLRRVDHLTAFVDRQRQRFFAIHILTGITSQDRGNGMPMVGGDHHNGVQVLAVEQSAKVAIVSDFFRRCLISLSLVEFVNLVLSKFQLRLINVADGGDLCTPVQKTRHVAPALSTLPICPVTIRSFAPKTELGIYSGATIAPATALNALTN